MKQSYQDVLKSIEEVCLAHPLIKSADSGRELEFDFSKNNQFPRSFVRTEGANISAGEGSAEVSITLTLLVMDRIKTDRSNMVDVLNNTFSILLAVLGTLHAKNISRLEEEPDIVPLYDYQDSQSGGWSVTITVPTDMVIQCYPV